MSWQLFTYVDGQRPLEAFQAACRALRLSRARVGVEALKLRLRELRLLEAAAPAIQIESGEHMIAHARHLARIAPNIAIKIPATAPGLAAMESLTAEGIRVNATVCFTVPQALAVAEAVGGQRPEQRLALKR